MKEIILTNGMIAKCDAVDYDLVSQHKWYAKKYNNLVYASTTVNPCIKMHRLILGPGGVIDHIDCDGLNNQRSNLRKVTQFENCCNRRIASNNTTGYKGVCRCCSGKKFCARIKKHGKSYWLGIFNSAVEAAAAYEKASKEIHSDFGRTS